VQIKLQYDMYYYENMSLLLDFQILVRTVYVVLTGKGAQ
jgi:lipopolysaccharide/colanic/teichoic acid biosynthesis glycosyltransferase